MPIVKIDSSFIANQLICPAGKGRIEFVCADQSPPGFYAEVRATSPGECTYYLRYKDPNGISRHSKIGRSKEISLAEARKKAKEIKSSIVLGADPRGEERAKRAIPTLNELFDMYLDYAKARKRSWKSDESIYRVRLRDKFGHLRIDMIKRVDVLNFHAGLLKEVAPATADHAVKCLRRLLNYSMEAELIARNPCAKFPLVNPDNRVFVQLTQEQLSSLLSTLQETKTRAVPNMALWLLATSCRLAECLNAQWTHIDRENRRWYIPPTVSKSKRGRWVPLSDTALGILAQLTTEGRFPNLFVNERTQKPYTSFMPVWRRLRVKAGLPTLSIRSLRSISLSLMANRGVSLLALKEIAGHSDVRITAARYTRMADATLLAAVQVGSLAIQSAANRPSVSADVRTEDRGDTAAPEHPPATDAGAGAVADAQPEAA